MSIVAGLLVVPPAAVTADSATTTTLMRPVADAANNWLVKPGAGAGQAWAALDDEVTEPTSVGAVDWIWAGGSGRVSEVAMGYPWFGGMQPVSAAVKFYANSGAGTQLLVESVACGTVRASMTVPAGQGFAWRSFNTNPGKLYCGPTGQDQRMHLRFTTIGGGDSNVRAAYVSVGLATSERFTSVMEYNVSENTTTEALNNGNLAAVIKTIRERNADIVLLNEVLFKFYAPPIPVGFDAVQYMAQQLGYQYWYYQPVTVTGLTGNKGVAMLSRFPLLQLRCYKVPVGDCAVPTSGTFGIIQATMNIHGTLTEVFSLRFSPMHRQGATHEDPCNHPIDPSSGMLAWYSNYVGHFMAQQIVGSIPTNRAVIMGGDFNANWRCAYEGPAELRTPWSVGFRDNSGLKDSLVEYQRPFGNSEWDNRVDYMYFRGPLMAKSAVMQEGYPGASDHGYVYTVLGYSQTAAEELLNNGGGSMNE